MVQQTPPGNFPPQAHLDPVVTGAASDTLRAQSPLP